MPNVAILCEFETLSGGERSMLSTLPTLRDGGWGVTFIAPAEGSLAKAASERGLPLIGWSPNNNAGELLSIEARRERLGGLLAGVNPDLIHANSLAMARLAGPVASAMGVPSIGHLRDIIRLNRRVISDLNANTRLIAVSEATRAHHVAQGLDASHCVVRHNGVDLERFAPRPCAGRLHQELGIAKNAAIVGSIGQIGLRKGLDTLLDAATIICEQTNDVHFLIIGERWSDKDESVEYERRLHALAQTPPLAGRVHFSNYRSDVPRVMNELTLLAHAARQEPLGRVLLEAAASGLPTVATDVGGTREIFPSDDTALLVPKDDPRAMAEAMMRLLKDDGLRRRIANAARMRAVEAFDAKDAAKWLLRQYDEVVRSK